MSHRLFILTIFLTLALPLSASAHPGRTDASGCHTCRTNCANWDLSTGEYHCHNAKSAPQPEPPIHSVYGSGGTGYTVPAPNYEYKTSSSSAAIIPPATTSKPKPESKKKVVAPVAKKKQPRKAIEKKIKTKEKEVSKKPTFASLATTSTTTSLITTHATPTATTTNPAQPKASFLAKLFQKLRRWGW